MLTHADAWNRPARHEKKHLHYHTLVDSQALEPTLWLEFSPLTNASFHGEKLLSCTPPISLMSVQTSFEPAAAPQNRQAPYKQRWSSRWKGVRVGWGRQSLRAQMEEWNKQKRVWLGSPFSNQISHSWRLEYGTSSPPSPSSDTSSPASSLSDDQFIKN